MPRGDNPKEITSICLFVKMHICFFWIYMCALEFIFLSITVNLKLSHTTNSDIFCPSNSLQSSCQATGSKYISHACSSVNKVKGLFWLLGLPNNLFYSVYLQRGSRKCVLCILILKNVCRPEMNCVTLMFWAC